MLKKKLAVLAATGLIASCVGAETTVEANIRKALEPRLNGAKIEAIKETPYAGLYEVRVGGDILYTDKKYILDILMILLNFKDYLIF